MTKPGRLWTCTDIGQLAVSTPYGVRSTSRLKEGWSKGLAYGGSWVALARMVAYWVDASGRFRLEGLLMRGPGSHLLSRGSRQTAAAELKTLGYI